MRKSLFSFFVVLSITTCARTLQPRQKPESFSKQTLAAQVAAVVADRRIFRVTPATVSQKLRSLVELKAAEPTKYVWQFKGANSGSGVRWAQAEFQPVGPGSAEKWQFLQIRLGLRPPDGNFRNFYEALSSEIRKRLGRPSEEDDRRSWRVAKYQELAIRDGEFENPLDKRTERVVLIEIAVLQGEEDK